MSKKSPIQAPHVDYTYTCPECSDQFDCDEALTAGDMVNCPECETDLLMEDDGTLTAGEIGEDEDDLDEEDLGIDEEEEDEED
jgi:DNA-directed RNA polymerase subunit RPC12/RpoP